MSTAPTATDPMDLPASEMARLVRTRALSPVELVEASLRRIERLNPTLNAVCTLAADQARSAARALEQKIMRGEEPGPLCGVPVGIKDVTETAGIRTTYGSPLHSDNVPAEDALVVQRLKAAGAVVMGKTNTPEFATGGNTFNEVFGRTRNPWNPAMSAGGSTGGGAAALASGMIGLAEGTDMGGSLRIPASFCGVVGLRPSPGLVPTWPSPLQWDDLQVTGGMARTADDIALMLDAVAGPSPYSPISQRTEGRRFLETVRGGDGRGWRCAYSPDIGGVGVDPVVERVCRAAALRLRDAGVVVEATDFALGEFLQSFRDLRGLWMVAWQHERLDRLDRFGDNTRNNVNYGLSLDVRRLAAAQKGRAAAWHKMRAFFARHDFLLTPCVAVPPFSADVNYPPDIAGKPLETYVDWLIATFLVSITGLPAASAPAGLTADRLPIGLQIVGPQFGEERVLTLAKLVQQTSPLSRPPLTRTSGA
jgi:amidase